MPLQFNKFDLNLLRALDALLHQKSVTRAAEQLHVTQQAMSGSLKRLREHLNDELLVRIGQRLELTPLGNELMMPVREVLLQASLALMVVPSFDPAKARRRFRIALSDYTAFTIFPLVMARLASEAPGLECELYPVDDNAFVGLEHGDLDISIIPSYWRLTQQERPQTVRTLPLFEDDTVCAIDASFHDFDELTLERYLCLSHAAVRLNGSERTIVEDAWIRKGVFPRVVVSTLSFSSVVFMIPGTPLIATVQRRLGVGFARLLPIQLLECPISVEPLVVEMNWHARSDNDPAHLYLRHVFAIVAESIDDDAVN